MRIGDHIHAVGNFIRFLIFLKENYGKVNRLYTSRCNSINFAKIGDTIFHFKTYSEYIANNFTEASTKLARLYPILTQNVSEQKYGSFRAFEFPHIIAVRMAKVDYYLVC